MSKTFEQILDGRKLHELTDTEIEDIIKDMSPSQMRKFDKEVQKSVKKKKAPGKKAQENMADFNKALFS